jgi:hypothetical protein
VLACGGVGCADVIPIPIGQVVAANRNRACIRASPIIRLGLVVDVVLGVLAFACLPEFQLCLEVIFVPANGCEVAIAIVVAVLARCAVVLDQPGPCWMLGIWGLGIAFLPEALVVCIGTEGDLLYVAGDLVLAPLRVAMRRRGAKELTNKR